MVEATWIPEGNIVGDDRHVKRFEDEALEQGIDLKAENILFPEAVVAGWS